VQSPPGEVRDEPKEGLSLQTLIIAAISSGVAALVVSNLWEQGTVLASAMTPVIVAIVADLVKKPVESEKLRSGVRNVSSLSRPSSGRTPTVMAPPPRGLDDPPPSDDDTEAGPVRVYSSDSNKKPLGLDSPRRRLHLKIAVITGLIAFVIAAAALTLPELVFGSSVGSGDRNTTFFGGGSSSKDEDKSKDGESKDGQSDQPTDEGDQPDQQDPEAPVVPGDEGSGDTPEGENPAPTPDEPTEPAPSTPPETPSQPQVPAPSTP
jgi:hypothetical protein